MDIYNSAKLRIHQSIQGYPLMNYGYPFFKERSNLC